VRARRRAGAGRRRRRGSGAREPWRHRRDRLAGRGRDALDIPLELYVAQVLSAEGEPNAPEASAQALAMAIRTYCARSTPAVIRRTASTSATPPTARCCGELRGLARAAQATLGLVLTYQGAPADLYYSASCGGHTERASDVWPKISLPYLEAVEDDVHGDDPYWTLEKSLDEIRAALARRACGAAASRTSSWTRATASGAWGAWGCRGSIPRR
jgi:stage II sporulation protein D